MNNQKEKALKNLQSLRNIGPAMAELLYDIGVKSAEQMKKSNPEKLYEKARVFRGGRLDKCVLYVFRGAILDIPWPLCKDK